ncbi:hypothetical protein NLG97_g1350 [Lecanicillium saksenae]|uniref:Uncharacterized protein n=1 Tax=Lecanicillium saksenae TaxID=468837 RepID=A0ACC1R4L7_9HYPO|nr:hypothetical protein NLG97_g1350 [Lecanicillium saksenae]
MHSLTMRWIVVTFGLPALARAIVSMPRDSPEKHGNWSTLSCEEVSWSNFSIPSSVRWRDSGADDAWRDCLASWETDRKRNDSFPNTFSRSVGRVLGYNSLECGRIGTPYTCSPDLKCTNPAANTITGSLFFINTLFEKIASSQSTIAGPLEPGKNDPDIKMPKDDKWRSLFSQLVLLGTASAVGGLFYVGANDTVSPTSGTPYVTAYELANTTIAVAQEWTEGWAAGKPTGYNYPTSQDTFAQTMNQAAFLWKQFAQTGLQRLFDGSDSSIDKLTRIISDGKIFGADYHDTTYEQGPQLFYGTLFAFNLEAIWAMKGTVPFILDSGRGCNESSIDGLGISADIRDTAGACVEGRQYYLVSAKDKGKDFTLPDYIDKGKTDLHVPYFASKQSMPIAALVTGSVRTYLSHGMTNGNPKSDLHNATIAQGIIAEGIRAAGFMSIPVCNATVAKAGRGRGASASPGYPCNLTDSAAARRIMDELPLAAIVVAMVAALFVSV